MNKLVSHPVNLVNHVRNFQNFVLTLTGELHRILFRQPPLLIISPCNEILIFFPF